MIQDEPELRTLIKEIQNDLDAANQNFKNVKEGIEREADDSFVIMGLSGFIVRWYGSIESTFQRISKKINSVEPEGPRWHRDLLDRMVIDIPEVRPAVISDETRTKLDELMRFRHWIHHDYGASLDPDEVVNVAKKLTDIHPKLKREISSFIDTLESFIDSGDERE